MKTQGLIASVLFFVLFSPGIGASDKEIEIYSDFSPREFGRAPGRAAVKTYSIGDFSTTKTLQAGDPDGITTAVVISRRVVDSLNLFLEGFHERWLEPAWYWIEERPAGKIFHYYDNAAGIRFSFSAVKPGPEIFSVIDRFYRADPQTGNAVRRHYRENYVLRIHSAENFIEPWKDEISYEEALVLASYLGDRDQPLWGIRNGYGLLAGLPARIQEKVDLRLSNYRPVATNEDAYISFIRRIKRMEGDLTRNLHFEVMSKLEANSAYEFQLPEELVVRGKGQGRDLVLLYYDVLTRFGYQARFFAVKHKLDDAPGFILVFRGGPRGNWSVLTERDHFPDLTADWKAAPSIAANREVLYAEIDPKPVFMSRKIELPPPRDWRLSEH
jgi:hypothetical protein